MSAEDRVAEIEQKITLLKRERDTLLVSSGLMADEVRRILAFRTPKRTLCQLLRELHDVSGGNDREKIEQCLIIAKKMDARLVSYAGQQYTKGWYDTDGKFIG